MFSRPEHLPERIGIPKRKNCETYPAAGRLLVGGVVSSALFAGDDDFRGGDFQAVELVVGVEEEPDFKIRVRAQRFPPDMFYVNEFADRLKHFDAEIFEDLFGRVIELRLDAP